MNRNKSGANATQTALASVAKKLLELKEEPKQSAISRIVKHAGNLELLPLTQNIHIAKTQSAPAPCFEGA